MSERDDERRGVAGLFDRDEVEGVLSGAFYSQAPEVPVYEVPAPAKASRAKEPKPAHYKVICISMYTKDLEHLDGLVDALKARGMTKASRSALIRAALDQVDLDKIPAGSDCPRAAFWATRSLALFALLSAAPVFALACADDTTDADLPAVTDAGKKDSGTKDAGKDSGSTPVDAGTDATVETDSGAIDAGSPDSGAVVDSGAVDAGPADAGAVDAGPRDAGVVDAGPVDAGGGGGCGAGHLLINELQVAGATASDEWVEIYNPTNCAVDFATFKLVYRSAAGANATRFTLAASPVIPAKGYALFVNSTGAAIPGADSTYLTASMAATGGAVAIIDAANAVVDSVGYGTATNIYVKGAAAVVPPANQSAARTPNGADSGNNLADFKVAAAPTPKAAN
ncbi:hypothetical protein OUZ56_032369 [Daphnia magna]|uniref:LTD domain-containing protein n=1 Tax=Daphnia magna TaxID=35525 RepID=A0ABR0B8R2_9CRUS|nr:hypothetical protein OUZ56_032369 [Daphnia magna]